MTDLVETAALTDSVERDRVGVPVGGRFCLDSGHDRREIGSTGDSLRQTASPAPTRLFIPTANWTGFALENESPDYHS